MHVVEWIRPSWPALPIKVHPSLVTLHDVPNCHVGKMLHDVQQDEDSRGVMEGSVEE